MAPWSRIHTRFALQVHGARAGSTGLPGAFLGSGRPLRLAGYPPDFVDAHVIFFAVFINSVKKEEPEKHSNSGP